MQIVRGSTSAEAAAKEAERLDYPTYLCRQAKLLRQIQEVHRDAWNTQIEHPQVQLTWPRVHVYPCEWEIACSWGASETNPGTLEVTKTEQDAAVLWGYKLRDEYGKEVCRSNAFGRDIFWRDDLKEKGHIQVNCLLNNGSRLLPRNGLTISFSFEGQHLDFRRVVDGGHTVHWNRTLHQVGEKREPCISRRVVVAGANYQIHEATLRPILPPGKDMQLDFLVDQVEDPYGLFLETRFMKPSENGNSGFLFTVTTAYLMAGCVVEQPIRPFRDLRQRANKVLFSQRTGGGSQTSSLLEVSIQYLSGEELKCYRDYYKPHPRSVEGLLFSIEEITPAALDMIATIMRMGDLVNVQDNIYCDQSQGLRSGLLVPL